MRITTKGQVTIPQRIRERFGLLPSTEVEFVIEGNAVRIRRAGRAAQNRGAEVVRRLKGRTSVRMSTDEIMKLTRQS
jgi:AbrB family looped-hinge helix DNA binding protein